VVDMFNPFEEMLQSLEDGIMKALDDPEITVSWFCEMYERLDAMKQRVVALDAYMASAPIARKMRDIQVVNNVTLERKTGKPRQAWQHDRLKPIVIEKILERHVDKETGVIAAPYSVLMDEILNAVSFSSWKVTVLRKLGVDPDRYCDQKDPKTSIIVRR